MDLRVKVPISEKNEQRNKTQLCASQPWMGSVCGCRVGSERLKQMWDSYNRNGGTKIWGNSEIELLTCFVLLNVAFLFHKVYFKKCMLINVKPIKKVLGKRFLDNEIHLIALQ